MSVAARIRSENTIRRYRVAAHAFIEVSFSEPTMYVMVPSSVGTNVVETRMDTIELLRFVVAEVKPEDLASPQWPGALLTGLSELVTRALAKTLALTRANLELAVKRGDAEEARRYAKYVNALTKLVRLASTLTTALKLGPDYALNVTVTTGGPS